MGQPAALPGASWTDSTAIPKPVESPIKKPAPLRMRFPLPVAGDNGLTMPTVAKTADDNGPGWKPNLPQTLPHATPTPAPTTPAPTYQPYMPHPLAMQPPPPPTPTAAHNIETPEPPVSNHNGPSLGSQLRDNATNAVVQTGANAAVQRGVSRLAPNAIAPRAGVAGGALWAAPVNAGLDLLDAGGIYSTDEMKNHRGNVHFWRQPVMGADGQPVRNSDGSPQLRSGFNPAAFGWNMAGHQRATTPDGTIVNGLSTGHPGLDAVGSYGSSAINASGPFQSAWALAQSAHEANPLNDTINPNTRRAWGDVFTRPGGARAGDTAGGSMPLIMANSLVSDPLQPNAPFMPGGPLFENGARPYREQNRYHATYNPTGRIGRPTGFLDWFSRPGY